MREVHVVVLLFIMLSACTPSVNYWQPPIQNHNNIVQPSDEQAGLEQGINLPSQFSFYTNNTMLHISLNGSYALLNYDADKYYLIQGLEFVDSIPEGIYCQDRWRERSADVSSLNISLYECSGNANIKSPLNESRGFGVATYFFILKDDKLVLVNDTTLAENAQPIDSPAKALDIVKVKLMDHYGWDRNLIFNREQLSDAGCGKYSRARMTGVKTQRNGYEVIILRSIQYPCVPPALFEEHYLVATNGTVERLSNKEIGYCSGLDFCYD